VLVALFHVWEPAVVLAGSGEQVRVLLAQAPDSMW
jgi:hypothetical protein